MNIRILCAISVSTLAAFSLPTFGQSAFQDLNFEAANVTGNGGFVAPSSALPGWTVFYGNAQQTQMGYNLLSLGTVNATLLNAANGAISGNYSVLLQGGQGNGGPASASISQTGLIPSGTQTLFFKAAGEAGFEPFDVLIGNQNVTYNAVGDGANYILYAANVSAWAGQTELLTFLAPSSGELNNWNLDDISFSPIAVVPEPSPLILTGIGGLIFKLTRRFWKR